VKVLVQLLGSFARQVENPEFWMFLNGDATLRELLKSLTEHKGVKINIESLDTLVLVNGLSLKSLDYKLKDMDKVTFLSLVFGG
jgi:molybdopterin converting factor small subunit